MPTSFTTNLRLSNPGLGDTGWGTTVSNGMIDLTDQAIAGQASVSVTAAGPFVLTMPDGTSGDARNMFLRFTGTPGGAREVQVPTNRKLYFVTNDSDGAVTVKVSGQTGVVVPVGASMALRINAAGTDVAPTFTYAASLSLGTALPVASGGTGITAFGTGVATALGQNVTGSGGIVLSTSPTLSGPTVSSGNLSFSGTAQRITGDFSNATLTSRVMFQTSTTNGATSVSVLPNGSSTEANVAVFANSSPTNSAVAVLAMTSTDARVLSAITGSGTYVPLTLHTGGAERARIDASGNVFINTTSTGHGGNPKLVVNGASGKAIEARTDLVNDYALTCGNTATSGDNNFIYFGTEANGTTGRGSITYNRAGGLVAYNTTSDYRAKDIFGPVNNSGATIDALKVYIGRIKGATQSRPMLVAHEAQAVAPYSVTGEKDAVNEDGTPKYQQMDVSALVPLLIAEIQSLRARVAALETHELR
jgi:hypothetical protein